MISADGRWVAHESDEIDGVVQVYVRSFPDGGRKVRASAAAARWPRWGAGGDLYYWDTNLHRIQMLRVRDNGQDLVVSPGDALWEPAEAPPPALARVLFTPSGTGFDVHPSEGRFLVLESSTPPAGPQFSRPVVVLGWTDELRARLR